MNFDGRLDNELITNIKSTESGELINEAINMAKQSDVIILAIGGTEYTYREVWNNHWGDNFNLDLIGAQTFLIKELYWINYRRTSLYK